MRIVIIDKEESQKVGGVTTYNERFVEHARRHHHEVSILRFCKKRPIRKDIYRIPYYLAEQRSFIILPTENALTTIRTHLHRLQPDIIYTSIATSPLDFFLPSLCNELQIPLAGVWHADFNSERSPYQILAKSFFLAYVPFCNELDMLHVFSQKLADFYMRKGIEKGKILVLPNGVDPAIYSPGPSRFAREHSIKTGIVFLGRLTLQKNPEVLIQSFLALHPDKSTKLILVGYGDLEEMLREKYHDSRILFLGTVKDEKRKVDILRSCRIFVLPSRFEGMPLALLEGMSAGLACIATDAGASKELLDTSGITIPNSRLKKSLPVILELLLKHPEFTKTLGGLARKRILRFYPQERVFDALLSRFAQTIREYPYKEKKSSFDINSLITDKFKEIWHKAIDFNINF